MEFTSQMKVTFHECKKRKKYGDLLKPTGSSWSSEAGGGKLKALTGQDMEDEGRVFSPLQEEGRGKELAWGNQSNPFQS